MAFLSIRNQSTDFKKAKNVKSNKHYEFHSKNKLSPWQNVSFSWIPKEIMRNILETTTNETPLGCPIINTSTSSFLYKKKYQQRKEI